MNQDPDRAPETAGEPAEAGSPASPPPSPPPPRSVRPRTAVLALLAIGGSLWFGTKIGARSAADGAEGTAESGDEAGGEHVHSYYTCGMHPWVVLPKPGPCPICGMPLVPLDPAKFSGEVTIDPVVVQNIGVRIAPVTSGPLVQTLRTVGTVDYDETRVRDVNVKIAGWVQKLHVDSLGQPVRKGDPLFEIYAPDLYAAQQEYLLALRGGKLGGDGGLVEAARTKLAYFDVPPSEIAKLEARGGPSKTLTLRSPYSGVVTEKMAVEGMRIDPGMRAFRIADLSKVWAMVTVYEYQLPFVKVGQPATMTLPYLPGEELHGKVVYVYPYLDKKARQAQVRVEFDNPGLQLKPGMYATISLEGTLGEKRTLAPREAVIDTGERKVAFVSKGKGRFEPRNVETGVETDGGTIEILKGLSPGEEVVTSGQFLLDSEAKVREALAKMIGANLAEPAKKPAEAPAGPVAALPGPAGKALADALRSYLAVGDALAKDDLSPVPARAAAAAEALARLTAEEIPGEPHFWHLHDGAALVESARALAKAGTLDDARKGFAALSAATAGLVQATGVPPGLGAVEKLHCPMYGEKDGSTWLQAKGDVRNPYYGKAMLACFDARSTLPASPGAEAVR